MPAEIRIVIASTSSGSALSDARKDIKDLGDTAEKSGAGFDSLKTIATGALMEVGRLAVNALGQAAGAVAGFLKDSVSAAGDFEAGMNGFAAAAGESLDAAGLKVEDFKNLFLDLGKKLPVSTKEVQEAATTLIKGGIDPLILKMGGLESSLQFAAAAGMDLSAAAELSIKQLGTFVPVTATAAEQTEFLAKAQDLLVKAAGASTLDVDKLGDAMLAAGGQARAMGLDYQDFVTTMGLISPAFGSAAEAGTSFKNFLVRLNPSTDAAGGKMRELGLMTTDTAKIMKYLQAQGIQPLGDDLDTLGNQFTEHAAAMGMTAKETEKLWKSFDRSAFFDAQGAFVGTRESAELLKNAMANLSAEQRVAALQTIFGNDAMGAASALLSGGAEAYDTFAEKMAMANGVQGQAQTMQQGFNVAMDNFKGSLEALQITVGTALLPVLTDLFTNVLAPGVNIITDFVGGIFSADDPISELIMRLYDISPALGGFVYWLRDAIPQAMRVVSDFWVSTLQPALAAIGQWLGIVIPQAIGFVMQHWDAFKGALIAIGAVLAGAAIIGAVAAVGAAIATLVNPITLIIAAAALLGAAWSGNWFGIQSTLTTFWETTGKPIFDQVVLWLQTNIPIAIQAVTDFWNNVLMPALAAVWAFITDYIIPIFSFLVTTTFVTVMAAVQSVADFWNNILKPALNAVWTFLSVYVIPLFTALVNVTFALVKKGIEMLAALWTNVLKPALNQVWSFITTYLTPVLTWLYQKVIEEGLKPALQSIAFFILGTLVPQLTALKNTVTTTTGPALDTLTGIAGKVRGAIGAIADAVKDVISWLSDLAKKIDSISIPDWLEGHSPPPLANWLTAIGDAAQYAGQAAFPALRSGIRATTPLVGQMAGTANTAALGNRTSTATYSRTVNYSPTYNNVSAPPEWDSALASVLAGV